MQLRFAITLPLLLLMTACASMHEPLQSRVPSSTNIIDVAAIEVDAEIKIRRLSVLSVLGSSGLVLDNALMVAQREEYQKKAGEVGKEAVARFKESLLSQLKSSGYVIRDSGISYWDYYKGKHGKLRQSSGGILRIQLKHVGFWSNSMNNPYQPSVIAIAELIDPESRKTLYRDRFAIGFNKKEMKMFSAYFGEVKVVRGDAEAAYEHFRDLVAAPEESREALLKTAETAATILADGLGRPAPRLLAVEKATPEDQEIPVFKNSL